MTWRVFINDARCCCWLAGVALLMVALLAAVVLVVVDQLPHRRASNKPRLGSVAYFLTISRARSPLRRRSKEQLNWVLLLFCKVSECSAWNNTEQPTTKHTHTPTHRAYVVLELCSPPLVCVCECVWHARIHSRMPFGDWHALLCISWRLCSHTHTYTHEQWL